MKRMRGLSAVSAVCMALTGIAGAIPALPAPAAVYAAESTDAAETAVSAEVLQFCKDALSALDGYQAQYFTRDETANVEFLYFYGSDLLKKAGKKGTVPFSELEAVLKQNGFSKWNLKEELAKIKDGSGKPVFDSEKETVTLFADNYEQQPVKNRLLSIEMDKYGQFYYVSAAVCTLETGDPAALELKEFADYCDYDAAKKTFYRIGQPILMKVSAYSDSLSVQSYEETDCYAAGGKLYALMHSDTENLDYKMSYAPLKINVQVKNALTGEVKAAEEWNLDENPIYNERGYSEGTDGRTKLSLYDTLGYLQVLFPKDDTRLAYGGFWKTETGDFTFEMKPGKACTADVTCEDAKGSRAVKDCHVQSEGETTLSFVVTKDPEQIKADELSALLGQMYFYDMEFVDTPFFKEDDSAPDDLVRAWTDSKVNQNLRPADLSWEESFTVPYKTYLEYADQLFAKHGDLKKQLGSSYDSKADTVKISGGGGVGGFGSTYLMLDYVEDDGVITVRGIHCTPEGGMTGWYVPEDAVEYYDYFSMVGSSGGTLRYSTGQPLEMKVRETENGYQFLSFETVSYARLGDHLYTRTYEKEPHDYSTPFTNIVYTPVTVTVLDNKTGLPVEVKTTLDGKGGFTAATADGKIKVTASEGIETLYDNIGWRYAVNPLTFTVTGDCTVNGIDGKELKSAGKEKTYQLAAKDGASEIVLSFGKAPELGDISGNGAIGIEDAQNTLIAYTETFAGNDPKLTPAQQTAADINGDGKLTAEDAQYILIYYTENKVAGNAVTWEQLLKK